MGWLLESKNSRFKFQPFLPNAAAAAKSPQLCPTLCNPIEGSPLGSSVPGILQARTLEWVANSFSNAWKWKVKGKLLSRAQLLATPWTGAYQAPPSMGFSRQEYWSGVPLPSPVCFPKLWQIYFESLYPLPSAVSGIEMWLNQYLMNWVEHKKWVGQKDSVTLRIRVHCMWLYTAIFGWLLPPCVVQQTTIIW